MTSKLPSGHPSKFNPRLKLVNFDDRRVTGGFKIVRPLPYYLDYYGMSFKGNVCSVNDNAMLITDENRFIQHNIAVAIGLMSSTWYFRLYFRLKVRHKIYVFFDVLSPHKQILSEKNKNILAHWAHKKTNFYDNAQLTNPETINYIISLP